MNIFVVKLIAIRWLNARGKLFVLWASSLGLHKHIPLQKRAFGSGHKFMQSQGELKTLYPHITIQFAAKMKLLFSLGELLQIACTHTHTRSRITE